MGSQWAPVMCSLVALHRELTYSILCDQTIHCFSLLGADRASYTPSARLSCLHSSDYFDGTQVWTKMDSTTAYTYPLCSLVHLVM